MLVLELHRHERVEAERRERDGGSSLSALMPSVRAASARR